MCDAGRRTLLTLASAVALTLGSSSAVDAASAVFVRPAIQHVCDVPAGPHQVTCFALRLLAAPGGYGPSDLQSAYKLPSSQAGGGQTVAIVDAYNDPAAESDLAAYRSRFNLPACTTANGCFRKVNQQGNASPMPGPDAGWAAEESLDVDMVSAICPHCNILLVVTTSSNDSDVFSGVNAAVRLGAGFVSNSYGGSETSSQHTSDLQYFRHPGVAITASTGDSGYGVSYPASSHYVTAVGGTALSQAANGRGWSEAAWSGAGSGCSAIEIRPAWQNVTTHCAHRAVADVSAVADPRTGVAVYDTYGAGANGWAVYGGTSVSSPIIASVYALAGRPAATAFPATFPYAHRAGFFDVKTGRNGTCANPLLCVAGAGWDGPTGLGTPNGISGFVA
jgi:subtilase family serine protease